MEISENRDNSRKRSKVKGLKAMVKKGEMIILAHSCNRVKIN